MNNEFLMLLPNAIGTVEYKWKSLSSISQQQKEAFVDNYTCGLMHVLVRKAIYGNSDIDVATDFMSARKKAKEMLEDSELSTIIKKTQLQIGNQECLDFVLKISDHPNFKGWVNEPLITAFIAETKSILKSQSNNVQTDIK